MVNYTVIERKLTKKQKST